MSPWRSVVEGEGGQLECFGSQQGRGIVVAFILQCMLSYYLMFACMWFLQLVEEALFLCKLLAREFIFAPVSRCYSQFIVYC